MFILFASYSFDKGRAAVVDRERKIASIIPNMNACEDEDEGQMGVVDGMVRW